jgi:glucan phosphoethanolaminetransferase (alkaline phosphatase superfamily)
MEGGPLWMSILTLELIALLFAAWKAPAWVIEIGIIALFTGPLGYIFGIIQISNVIQAAGDISMGLMAGGFKMTLIPVIYGILIFILSLIIRIIQKPRLL